MAMVSSGLPIPPFPIPVFLDSTLDTRLAVLVSSDDTVASLKRMIEMDHAVNFPEIGSVIVKSIKVMFKGSLYNMCNSMLVKSVLRGDKKRLFLHVEVVPLPAPNSNSKGPTSGEQKKLNDKDCEINLVPNQATNNNVQTDKGESNGTEANPDPDGAAKENEFLNGLDSNACLERETSLSDADQIILSTLMDLKKQGHEENKANEEPGCQSLADSETGKALNGENKHNHFMLHNFVIEKVNIIDYLRPETTNQQSKETKKRSKDPNQQSGSKKKSKDSNLPEETKKRSKDPNQQSGSKKKSNDSEQSKHETRKRSKDPELSEQTKKGSKDPQQSNDETKKGSKDRELSKDESKKKSKDSEKSKDPELSNDESRKRSKDTEQPKEETKKRKRSKGPEQSKEEPKTRSKGPEQSKEEPKTRSKGPEQSKEETRKRSKDPEQSKEETRKRSKGPEQSKEETRKRSKGPEQSKEETKKRSKDPEQSNAVSKKRSKDPEQSKAETKKRSNGADQSKETKKRSKDPKPSLSDDMAYLSESMGSEDEAERYKVAIRVPSKTLAASAFIFNDDDKEIQSNSISRDEQDTRPSRGRVEKKLVNNEKKVLSGVDKKLKNNEKGIILALQSQTT